VPYSRLLPSFTNTVFEAELEKMDCLAEEGVQVETAHWQRRSLIYYIRRNVRHAKDGSFSSTNPAMSQLIQRRQGTHTSNSEKDVLTQALGTKEHPGRTRGTGVVPWKLAFPEESHTYRSRSRGRAEQEAECLRQLKAMKERMDAWIEATVEARVQQILLPKGSGVPQNPTPTAFSP
jgi:hypothetical protein